MKLSTEETLRLGREIQAACAVPLSDSEFLIAFQERPAAEKLSVRLEIYRSSQRLGRWVP